MRATTLLALTLVLAAGLPAAAKPKIVSNGCTAGQIQSDAAAGCIRQMEQDILHNRPTTHAVYCSSTGKILCCEYDQAGQTVPHSCTVVGRKASTTGITPDTAGTLSR